MLNLGNITFGLAVNTSGLDAGARVLEGFGRRVDQAMAKQGKGFEYNTTALRKQEAAAIRAMQQIQNMSNRIQSMTLDPKVKLEGVAALSRAYDDLIKRMATPVNRTLDPLQFQRATLGFKEQVDAVNRSLTAQATTATKVSNDVTAAFNKQQMAAAKAEHQVAMLNDQIARAASAGQISSANAATLSSRANQAGSGFGGQMQQVGLDPRAFLQSNLQLKESLTSVRRDLMATAKSVNPLTQSFHALTGAAALTVGPLSGLVFRMRASQDMMSEYGLAVGGVVAGLSGLALAFVTLGSSILNVTIQYQKAEVTLTGLLRSNAMAVAEIGILRDVANQAGLSFADLAPQFSRFVSAAQGSGQALGETNEQFRQMALLSGTLHLTTEEVNRVLLAFDQMLSAGKIMGDDMRQLRNVLPAAYEAAGDAAEKMGTKFRDASGKINTLDPSKFIGNLLDVYMTMFNINVNKPIESLQASLTRINNSWQELILTLSQSIGASEKFGAVFDKISGTMMYLKQNMTTVLSVAAAVVGALSGVFAAIAALGAVQAVAAGFAALNALWVWGTTVMAAYTASTMAAGGALTFATRAQITLNAAMTANPIGGIIKVLLMLAAAVGGATWAYNAMNEAVTDNNSALADTSGIDAYIVQCQRLGQQVAETTAQMIRMANVASAATLGAQQAARRQMVDASNAYQYTNPNGTPVTGAAAAGATAAGIGAAARLTAQGRMPTFDAINELLRQDFESSVTQLNTLTGEVRNNTARMRALGAAAALPEMGGGPGSDQTLVGKTNGSGGSAPDADRGLRVLNDIINRSKTATTLLNNMWRGPTHSGLIQALDEVNRRLFDMDADQLARLNEMLSAAGVNVGALGGISSALAVVTMEAENAEQMVKRFNDVWTELKDGQQVLADLNREIEYLAQGGDPNTMWLVQAGNKARDTIRTLTTQDIPQLRDTLSTLTDNSGQRVFNESAIGAILNGIENSDAAGIEALNRALVSMGYNTSQTGEAAVDAEANLTSFYSSIDSGNDSLSRASSFFSDFNAQILSFNNTIAQMNLLASGGSLADLMNLDYLQRATEATKYLSDEALLGLRQQLEGLGMAGDTVNQMLANFYNAQDLAADQVALFTEILEGQVDAWTNFSDSAVDAFNNVIVEGESFKENMLNILADLGRTILNAAIFDPLKANLRSVITGMVQGQEGVGFGDVASTIGRGISGFFGQAGTNEGATSGMGTSDAAKAVKDLTSAAGGAATLLDNNFVQSVLQSVFGITTKTAADTTAASATFAATMALTTFTAAVLTAAAATAGDTAATIFKTVASVAVASGGQVFGPGGPVADKIPAMLSDKEFVVNSRAAQKNLGLLNMINGGHNVRMLSGGGEVSSDMAGFYMGGPQRASLTSRERPTKMDLSTHIAISGNVDRDVWEEMKSHLAERDARMRAELPTMIDARVVESSYRGRY